MSLWESTKSGFHFFGQLGFLGNAGMRYGIHGFKPTSHLYYLYYLTTHFFFWRLSHLKTHIDDGATCKHILDIEPLAKILEIEQISSGSISKIFAIC